MSYNQDMTHQYIHWIIEISIIQNTYHQLVPHDEELSYEEKNMMSMVCLKIYILMVKFLILKQ